MNHKRMWNDLGFFFQNAGKEYRFEYHGVEGEWQGKLAKKRLPIDEIDLDYIFKNARWIKVKTKQFTFNLYNRALGLFWLIRKEQDIRSVERESGWRVFKHLPDLLHFSEQEFASLYKAEDNSTILAYLIGLCDATEAEIPAFLAAMRKFTTEP